MPTTTTTLTELQTLILTTAAKREDGSVFPLSNAAEAKRQTRSLQSLISRDLVERVPVTADEQSWKQEDGQAIGLVLARAGREAVDTGSDEQFAAQLLPSSSTSDTASETGAKAAAESPTLRPGTKQTLVLELLGRAEGATLNQLVSATGWLPHTARAALTGLRKRGHAIDSTKAGDDRTYRVLGAAS